MSGRAITEGGLAPLSVTKRTVLTLLRVYLPKVLTPPRVYYTIKGSVYCTIKVVLLYDKR